MSTLSAALISPSVTLLFIFESDPQLHARKPTNPDDCVVPAEVQSSTFVIGKTECRITNNPLMISCESDLQFRCPPP
jgi:hypothetical protein